MKKLSNAEYKAIESRFKERYGYEDRSDEEREAFNKRFEKSYQRETEEDKKNPDQYPKELNKNEYEAVRNYYEKKFDYAHASPQDRVAFNEKFSERYKKAGVDTSEETEPGADDLKIDHEEPEHELSHHSKEDDEYIR